MSTNHSADPAESGGTTQPPPWSPADVVAILEHAAMFMQISVSGLKNERLDDQGVIEGATVRDIVTHLAAWEAEFLREAEAAARRNHARFDYPLSAAPAPGKCILQAVATEAGRGWEEQQVERRRDTPTGAIFLELEQAQQRLLQLARGLNARKLAHEADWPWGRHSTLAELLVTAAAHKREHAESIREWRTKGFF